MWTRYMGLSYDKSAAAGFSETGDKMTIMDDDGGGRQRRGG